MTKQTKKSEGVKYVEGHFAHSEEEEQTLTIYSYIRLKLMGDGDAVHGDRLSMRVRLLAGLHLLDNFEYDSYNRALLMRGLEIVAAYRPQLKRDLRKVDVGSMGTLTKAVDLVAELMKASTLWEQVVAYKYGEDNTFIGSETYTYEPVTIH